MKLRGLITWLRLDPAVVGDAGDYADIAWISSSPFANNDAVKPSLSMTATNSATIVISFPTSSGDAAGYVGKNLRYDLEGLAICPRQTGRVWLVSPTFRETILRNTSRPRPTPRKVSFEPRCDWSKPACTATAILCG